MIQHSFQQYVNLCVERSFIFYLLYSENHLHFNSVYDIMVLYINIGEYRYFFSNKNTEVSMNSFDEVFEKVKSYCLENGKIPEIAIKTWINPLVPLNFNGTEAVFSVQTEAHG